MEKMDNDAKRNKEHFVITNRKEIVKLKTSDILYFEKELRLIHVHAIRGIYSFYGTFKCLETRIDERFCRCHCSFIVNLDKISKIERYLLHLENGETITISQRLYSHTRKSFQAFLR